MVQLRSGLRKFYKSVLVTLNYASVFVIFLMAVWVFCDVVGRYVLNHPIPGTTELVKCYIVAIVFLGVAYTLNQTPHSDHHPAGPPLAGPQGLVRHLLQSDRRIDFLGPLLLFVSGSMGCMAREGIDGVQLKVPVYPARFVIVLGSGLFVIQEVIDIFTQVGKLKHDRGGTAR